MYKNLIGIVACISLYADAPHPIGYSIPESKIVHFIPEKDTDFAYVNPEDSKTYIYYREADYYADYKRSYFAITKKKGGWDCLRHYEILANGCIPYFLDLEQCDPNTMFFLPKDLILEAMHLEGVSYLHIDHKKFDHQKYYEILDKLLEHTREYLTTKTMASYVLETMKYSGKGNILYLCNDTQPEYLRDLTLIGLKENLKNRVVDVPKIDYIYKSYSGNIEKLYGRGMTYTRIVPDLEVDRSTIEGRIKNREFDIVIFAETHKGDLPFHDLVKEHYGPEEIAYMHGDDCNGKRFWIDSPYFFLREHSFVNNSLP